MADPTPPADPEVPTNASTADAAADDSADDLDTLISDLDLRYQLLYGRVSGYSLLGWLALSVSAFVFFDDWIHALLVSIGGLLVALFVMRAVIHARSRALYHRAESFADSNDMSVDALADHARSMPETPEFFVSLIDGPMARQRRRDATAQ